MKYSLRSLMIVAILGPPVLAGAWMLGMTIVQEFQRRKQGADEVWEEVAGPGTMAEFTTLCSCDFGIDEEEETAVERAAVTTCLRTP